MTEKVLEKLEVVDKQAKIILDNRAKVREEKAKMCSIISKLTFQIGVILLFS
jgi:hypothetical protein